MIVLTTLLVIMASAVSLPGVISAGDLEPPPEAVDGSGNPVSTMKTLDQIRPTWSQKLRADDGDPVTGCGSSRFECVMDGQAVLDKETGLVWERSPDDTLRKWSAAISHCYEREVANRKGWRLPTVEELASLVDNDNSNPPLPTDHPFSNVQSDFYLSSTTYRNDTTSMLAIQFTGGLVQVGTKSTAYGYEWCVRGGYGYDAY